MGGGGYPFGSPSPHGLSKPSFLHLPAMLYHPVAGLRLKATKETVAVRTSVSFVALSAE